ncbi:aspartyl protease family protein [Oligoflexus tunisiensis]|uniref:aspartyl protease family protein n=1 Tax=Oligoflexus tunisiensis TaxID=708132 RepID=UPI00159EF636|nr:aspartyl protease family protein [Oligoflexus tunisiensis]
MKYFLPCLSFFVLYGCVTVPKTSVWFPFEMYNNQVVVDIAVKGHPVKALIDTGASMTVIDKKLAVFLNIKSDLSGHTSTIASSDKTDFAVGVPFSFYGEDIKHNVAIRNLSGVGWKVLLGSSLLKGVVVEFDFPGRRMRFHDLGGKRHQSPTKPIKLIKNNSLYYTILNIDGIPRKFLIDTGAVFPLAVPSSRAEIEKNISDGKSSIKIMGAHNEETEGYIDVANPFAIGSYTFSKAKIAYYDRKSGAYIEGILGMGLFKSLTLIIDVQNNEMYLEAYE